MKLMRKKVLIVGANGLLGQNLLQAFERDYDRVASNRSDTFILAQPTSVTGVVTLRNEPMSSNS